MDISNPFFRFPDLSNIPFINDIVFCTASFSFSLNSSGGNIYHLSYTQTLIDCTDTSQVKVKFMVNNEDDSTNVQGDSSASRTYMIFTRLGDT